MTQFDQSPRDLPSTLGVIAIVEDDSELSGALSNWFGLLGLRTSFYASAESLLRAIRLEDGNLILSVGAEASRLAAAVLDINLPGMNGVELAQSLRSQAPELPLAIITALREDERARYGELPPGVQCLKKPFDPEALADGLFPLLH